MWFIYWFHGIEIWILSTSRSLKQWITRQKWGSFSISNFILRSVVGKYTNFNMKYNFCFREAKKEHLYIQTMTSLIFNENCTDIPFELHTTLLPSWVDLGIVIKERTYKDTGCTLILMILLAHIESDVQNLWLTNGCFTTTCRQILEHYVKSVHKNVTPTVIMRCWTGLNLNWFKSYDTNDKQAKIRKTQQWPLHCNGEKISKK